MSDIQIMAATPENCPCLLAYDDGITDDFGQCQQCGGYCKREHIHLVYAGLVAGVCSEACAIQLMPAEATRC